MEVNTSDELVIVVWMSSLKILWLDLAMGSPKKVSPFFDAMFLRYLISSL
jgi:hypothetical protein